MNQAQAPVTSAHWLQLLKEKASNHCFNCFAPDHRIGACRDPSQCILCLRSGHKARHCRSNTPPFAAPHTTTTTAATPATSSTSNTHCQEPKRLEDFPSRLRPMTTGRSSAAAADMESELIPGVASRRPDHVTICVPRSAAVREEERQLSMTALIGVHVDGRARLSSQVLR